MAGHVGMDFFERDPMDTCHGRMVWFGSKNPRPFNRQFTYMARVANVKVPWLVAFARHVEDSPKTSDWEKCSISHSQLVKLQTQGFLPPAYMVPVRAGLATYNGGEQVERFRNPSKGERVCLVPYLLRGLRFPIHPFLRGLLEFYGLQLHNLTHASILHIAGFMALCELFLGTRQNSFFHSAK